MDQQKEGKRTPLSTESNKKISVALASFSLKPLKIEDGKSEAPPSHNVEAGEGSREVGLGSRSGRAPHRCARFLSPREQLLVTNMVRSSVESRGLRGSGSTSASRRRGAGSTGRPLGRAPLTLCFLPSGRPGAPARSLSSVCLPPRSQERPHQRSTVSHLCKSSLFSDSEAFGELLTSTTEVVIGVGSLVRVTSEVRIFHLSGSGDKGFNLEGHEGVVVDRADLYKGVETTANMPFKVKFEIENAKGKKKKVFAHLTKFEIEAVKTVLDSTTEDDDE